MQAPARHKRISDYLHKVEFAALEELAKQVEASVSTVRRDLAALEENGQIKRKRGCRERYRAKQGLAIDSSGVSAGFRGRAGRSCGGFPAGSIAIGGRAGARVSALVGFCAC